MTYIWILTLFDTDSKDTFIDICLLIWHKKVLWNCWHFENNANFIMILAYIWRSLIFMKRHHDTFSLNLLTIDHIIIPYACSERKIEVWMREYFCICKRMSKYMYAWMDDRWEIKICEMEEWMWKKCGEVCKLYFS